MTSFAVGEMCRNRLHSPRLVVRDVVVLLLLSLPCAALSAADSTPAALPSLESVISEYVQAVSSLRTIDCKCHINIKPHTADPNEEAPMTAMDVRFVRDGLKVAMRISGDTGLGQKAIDMWVAFDGEKYSEWSASSAIDATSGYFAPRGVITSEEPTLMNAIPTLETFLGKRVGGGPMDLESLLKRAEARIIGWETVAGNPYLRVELGEHSRTAKNMSLLSHTVVLLDPKHSFLPRSIVTTHPGKTPRTKGVVVEEFEAVPVGISNGVAVWLPKTGSVTNSASRRDFHFDAFFVNQPLGNSEFAPHFPQGALVGQTLAGQPESKFLVGTPEYRNELTNRATLPDSSPAKTLAPAEAVATRQLSARPAPQNVIWWIICAGGMMLAIIAAIIRHRMQ